MGLWVRVPPSALFMITWSASLAYSVGLMTTDGNLSLDKRHISFTSSDRKLLETFLESIGKTAKISLNPASSISKKRVYRTQLSSVELYKWLVQIGLTPKKSHTIGKLKIPDIYFKDFLRGHLDGDGSIISYKDHYNTKLNPNYVYDRLFVYFLSSSYSHIEWLQERVSQLTNLKGSISVLKGKSQLGKSHMARLKFSTKSAKVLLNWIYYQPNLPCLYRKYLIAKPFLKYNKLAFSH